MNKISIIVPVFNGDNDIRRCLDSLIKQSIEVDIIVIDDGSKDNTASIVKEMSKKYSNIHYYYKENGGISSARNFGLSKIKTPYFGFLDADDYVDSTMYEKMLQKMEEENSDICFSNFKWTYPKHIKEAKDINYKNKKDLLTRMFATLWNKMYRSEWFFKTKLSFPIGLHYEDASLLYRLVLDMDNISYVDEAFVNYVQRDGSITHTFNIYINDMIEVFKDIKEYYLNKKLYNEYEDELEYLFIRFFLGNSYLRAIRIKDKNLRNETLKKGWDFLLSNYPDFNKNPYLKKKGLKNKYFRIMNKKLYFFNVYLFRLLYRLRIMK